MGMFPDKHRFIGKQRRGPIPLAHVQPVLPYSNALSWLSFFVLASAVALIAITREAVAVDVEANDFIVAPPGTNLLLGYYGFATASRFNSTITGSSSRKSHLNSSTGIFRYLYYNRLWGIPWAAQFIIPFSGLTGGEIGGKRLNDTFGAGDPTVSAGFWPVSNAAQKQYVAFFEYTSIPLGSHANDRSLSVGTNRASEDLLLDYTQGLPGWEHGFTIDLSADYIFYGNSNNSNARGQTLKEKPTYEASAWLDYDFTRTSFAAVGWQGVFGGTATIDGSTTGNKTEYQQIRAEYGFRPSPTMQITAKVYHEIAVLGGFSQDLGVLLRVVKSF